jgi:hypothetical protein
MRNSFPVLALAVALAAAAGCHTAKPTKPDD